MIRADILNQCPKRFSSRGTWTETGVQHLKLGYPAVNIDNNDNVPICGMLSHTCCVVCLYFKLKVIFIKKIKYYKNNMEWLNGNVFSCCNVCRSPVDACGQAHMFCMKCLNIALTYRAECPLCRALLNLNFPRIICKFAEKLCKDLQTECCFDDCHWYFFLFFFFYFVFFGVLFLRNFALFEKNKKQERKNKWVW